MLVLAQAGLSSYLCRLCAMCDGLPRLGGWYLPHHNIVIDRTCNSTCVASLTDKANFFIQVSPSRHLYKALACESDI